MCLLDFADLEGIGVEVRAETVGCFPLSAKDKARLLRQTAARSHARKGNKPTLDLKSVPNLDQIAFSDEEGHRHRRPSSMCRSPSSTTSRRGHRGPGNGQQDEMGSIRWPIRGFFQLSSAAEFLLPLWSGQAVIEGLKGPTTTSLEESSARSGVVAPAGRGTR